MSAPAAALRPTQCVSATESNKDDLNEMPLHKHMRIVTNDVASMSSILYAMCDLVGDLRIYVSQDKIEINERMASDNIFVALTMEASDFELFECPEPIVLCFEPKRVYDRISSYTSGHTMEWTLETHGLTKGGVQNPSHLSYFLNIRCYTSMDSADDYDEDGAQYIRDFSFRIPLLRSFREICKARPQYCDFLLAIDTTMFVNDILGTFRELDSEIATRAVEIDCENDRIVFQMHGHAAGSVAMAKFTLVLRKDAHPPPKRAKRDSGAAADANRDVMEDDCVVSSVPYRRVKSTYSLVYLLRLQKCFAINRTQIFMYIKENYPLIFRVRTGLGDLHCVLMFQD